MKVISGKYKGRILGGSNLIGTRPTMDRVKESLFAILQFKIKEKIILDLFAGSGSLGIESLSMGASKVYFSDTSKNAIKCIKTNLDNLKIEEEKYFIINKDYLDVLSFFKDKNLKVDIIFLDPPYATNYIEKSISLINKYDLLNENGLLVCETDDICKIVYDNFYELKRKKYGDKYIVILEKI